MSDDIQQPGAQIFDISGTEPTLGELPHDQLQDAVTSGHFALPKGQTIHVYDPEGNFGELPSDEAHEAFKAGYKYALPEEIRNEKYGSAGQMAKTALEGAAEGIAGPLAPMAEKALGVEEADILGRREENPITHGAGQVAGLGTSMVTGIGEGALMSKAGQAAAKAVGLGSETLKGASLLHKVGSAAVTQAAEMAVMQSSDETAKMILHDPKTSAESAIANIGLSAAFGGAGGAFITGAVNPLWEATGAPLIEKTLTGLKAHLNGGTAILPDELKAAKEILGINISPEIEAAMSGNEVASKHFGVLKEVGNKEITDGLNKFNTELNDSVSRSLGISPDDVAVHSENQAGHDLLDAFKKEYKSKYEPIADALEKRNAQAASISVSDDARLDLYGKLLENGMNKVGTDSPAYKLYNEYGNRLLAKENIGGMDMLKTELGGEIEKAVRAGDVNTLQALRDIRSSISEFQESQIENQAYQIGKNGIKSAEEIIGERQAANNQYRQFANMSNELTDHIGVGKFRGAGSLTNKLTDQVSAEQLLNKFSFKNNADFIPFLKQNFPEVYEKVRENELKRFVKGSVLGAKEGQALSIEKLSAAIEKGMAGQKEYVESIILQETLSKIQAANKLQASLPNVKSSGTAGHIARLFADMPRNAMAAIAALTGHNPIVGGVLGEISQKLGRDAPDAVRLAHLKYLGSDQPVKASAFKSMVDFFHNTYKGETNLSKATSNLFKTGAEVLTAHQMPNEADRTKLDKIVTQLQKTPDKIFEMQKGDVGHYLPNHQEAISQTTTNAIQYLQTLKPQPHILGPMDKPVPPQPIEIARYNRALNIAQQPTIVFQHIKEGRLQATDIQDLSAMYPGLYKQMQQKITNQMANAKSEDEIIPYRARVSMALFLGAPVDGTMTPQAIMSAQPVPKQPQGMQQPPGQKNAPSKLGKSNKNYQTPSQTAESDRANRD